MKSRTSLKPSSSSSKSSLDVISNMSLTSSMFVNKTSSSLNTSFIKTQVFNTEPVQLRKSDELIIDKNAFEIPNFIPV